ncbi:MAG: lysylphosphatidylglycerol synthase transmembrane domain-containing protein [Acidobacteriota bacterium]
MKKKIIIILSLIGILLFINLIMKIGLETIWDTIKNISPGYFFVLLLLRFVFWYIRTLNWKIIMEKCSITNPFWRIFRARVAGFAVNYLTPSANIGGEAARIMVINNKSNKNALASVILDKTIELIATIFFVMAAVAVAIYKIPMPMTQKYIYAGFVIFSVVSMIFILRKQHQGLLKWIITRLEKIKISFRFIKNNMEKIREVDENISEFYRDSRKSFFTVLTFYIVQMIVWTSEIFFTLHFLGMSEITFLKSFLIVSLGSIAFVMPVLPGGIGVYELTYFAIFKLLGLSTTMCMALVITRRVIALIWAGIGLIFLTNSGTAKPDIQDETEIKGLNGI